MPITVNGVEYAWGNIKVATMGRVLFSCLEISYSPGTKLKHIYGQGFTPRGISDQNSEPGGNLKIGQSDYDQMVLAAQAIDPAANISSLQIDIQIHFLAGTSLKKDRCVSCRFEAPKLGMKQNDAMAEIDLPFKCLSVLENVA